jgi:DUF1680 family protein
MRTVAALGGYVATRTDAGIQLHQYLPTAIHSGAIGLSVATRYPIDGAVEVTVTQTAAPAWTLSLRIPAWCRGASATVNGTAVEGAVDDHGYLRIIRAWHAGDTVALSLPMPLRLTVAHPAADATRGAVAIERGPVVYCLESPDQPDGVDLNRVELLADEPLTEEYREDLLGQPAVIARVHAIARDDSAWARTGWATRGQAPAPTGDRVVLTAIPYHLWANRGPSVMRTFVPVWRD